MVMLSQRNAVLLMLLACFFTGCAASESQLNAFRQVPVADPGPWPVEKLSAGIYKHHFSFGQYQSSPLGHAVRPVQKPKDGIHLINHEEVALKRIFELQRSDGETAVIEAGPRKSRKSVEVAGLRIPLPEESPVLGKVSIRDQPLADFSVIAIGTSQALRAEGTLRVGTRTIQIAVREDSRTASEQFFSAVKYVDFTEDGQLLAYLKFLPDRAFWTDKKIPEDVRFAIAATAVCIVDPVELADQAENARQAHAITSNLSLLR